MAFKDLIGKTIIKIDGAEKHSDFILFTCSGGSKFKMHHCQDCCESVSVEDICGDINDLLNTPVVKASEDTSYENPDGVQIAYQDSFTWTFYNVATKKGHVTIRWYGESNGWYSESVYFEEIK